MKLRPFELFLVVGFLAIGLLSLVFLSAYTPSDDNDGLPQVGSVEIWGTLPQAGMSNVLRGLAESNEAYRNVRYKEVSEESFNDELVNAIAEQTGPDVVLISHERITQLRSKLKPISYESLPRRDISTNYIDGAQIFALSDGMYAYPLMVDPLMLYWNKNILANSNYLAAPKTWEDLVNDYLPTLIERNPDRSIVRSVVALGEYQNIRNASGLLSLLLLQAGSQGVTNPEDRRYEIRLNQSSENNVKPLTVATEFYTRFSKPNNVLYSWNRSFSSDRDRFLSGDLVLYFGYGSEARELEKLNPNLSFDIAEVPQGATATVRRTFGRFYGLSALQSSDNLTGASIVMRDLAGQTTMTTLAQNYNMVPVLRSAVGAGSDDTYGRSTYLAATVAYGWLTPKPEATNSILNTLVTDVNENRRDADGAVTDALERLQEEYN